MQIWKTYDIAPGAQLHLKIGLLDLWVERSVEEWRIASVTGREGHDVLVRLDEREHDVPVAVDDVPKPDDVQWRRVLAPVSDGRIEISPAMPDRPLVVRPEAPLIIPPKGTGTFYVSIPVFVRVRTAANPPVVLGEVPTAVLSNTWFGEPTSGELCYAMPTRARRSQKEGLALAHRAVSPVRIVNSSGKDLLFQRLCLYVDALAVFDAGPQLAASGVEVTFQHEEQLARVKYLQGAPGIEAVGTKYADPRKPQTESALKRSFATIRSLTGL